MSGTSSDASRGSTEVVVGIAAERAGCQRTAGLTEPDRELYRFILRTFAVGVTPGGDELRREAVRLGVEPGTALDRLAEADLAHYDRSSHSIAIAYPFSGRPTEHQVHLCERRDVYAMCAVDALGIPYMLDQPAEVLSRDSLDGSEIRVRIDPAGETTWEPESAVVVAGATGMSGPSAETCCQFMDFFSSEDNARRYLREHPELRGDVLGMRRAIDAGRTIFGGLLDGDNGSEVC